jgi:surface protein
VFCLSGTPKPAVKRVGDRVNGLFFAERFNEFNQDISNWDVSNVTDMRRMFSGCFRFNQDIGGWDVSKVTDMQEMLN